MALHVLGVSSSMRVNSDGKTSLEMALQSAQAHGAEIQLLDLREMELPLYRAHASIDSEPVRTAKARTQWADALVLVTPDFHGSMSGTMKNYLDYHWSEFAGKVFAYLCTSHEKGLTAMDQMRTAVRQCYGWSLPYGVAIHGNVDYEDGRLKNDQLALRLKMVGRDLATYGALIRDQFTQDIANNIPDTFAARYRKK